MVPPTYLPHGFDPQLEEVDVAVRGQLTWLCQVAVMCPELLNLYEPHYTLNQYHSYVCMDIHLKRNLST